MREPEPLIRLGLNDYPEATPGGALPPPESLQFRRAQSLDAGANIGKYCCACSKGITGAYFQSLEKNACSMCAAKIQAGERNPPAHTLLKALPYGVSAALAGSALYAIFTIVTGFQFALLAILIGYMVGRAIRYASHGLGGRPQQVLALTLTYFAITSSYIPVAIYSFVKHRPAHQVTASDEPSPAPAQSDSETQSEPTAPRTSAGGLVIQLLILAAVAPFYGLSNASGAISLLIIFFGLQRAWHLTGQTDGALTGPYGDATGSVV